MVGRAIEILNDPKVLEKLPPEKLDKLTEIHRIVRTTKLEQIGHKDRFEHELHKVLGIVADVSEIIADKCYYFAEHEREINAILSPEHRKTFQKRMREFARHMKTYNKIYRSFHDERYSYSLPTWFKIYHDIEERGYGYAANKWKVEIIDKDGNKTGRYWKFTRKEVKKIMPKLRQLIIDSIDASRYFEEQYKSAISKEEYEETRNIPRLGDILVDWRDHSSELNGRIADRRSRLSPKLSETAFGADWGMILDE
jgi:hypothetical protein